MIQDAPHARRMHRFFLANLVLGLLVLAGSLVLLIGGMDTALPLERITLAALLYSLYAGYADVYFRPEMKSSE